MLRSEPKYEHDCERCEFIACVHAFGNIVDIYRNCNGEPDGKYIIRFGSDGWDYVCVAERDPASCVNKEGGTIECLAFNYLFCELVAQYKGGYSNA